MYDHSEGDNSCLIPRFSLTLFVTCPVILHIKAITTVRSQVFSFSFHLPLLISGSHLGHYFPSLVLLIEFQPGHFL